MKKTVSEIKEYVKNFHRRIRKKKSESWNPARNWTTDLLDYSVVRFGKCQDQHCHECPVQKCNSENATKRMFRHISTLSSVVNLRVQLEFFLMVAQYQLRHKITCRILNLKYAGKKRDGKRVSYCLHGNEPVYCWSYKLSSMTLIKTVIMTSLSSWRCKYFWRR